MRGAGAARRCLTHGGLPRCEETPASLPVTVSGYPLQYNLLRLERHMLTVETRQREEPNGAWSADARWNQGPGKDPAPRYHVDLS